MSEKKKADAPKMLGLRLNLTESERDQLRKVAANAGFRSMALYSRHVVLDAMKAATPERKVAR
jgi:hypothetical protein